MKLFEAVDKTTECGRNKRQDTARADQVEAASEKTVSALQRWKGNTYHLDRSTLKWSEFLLNLRVLFDTGAFHARARIPGASGDCSLLFSRHAEECIYLIGLSRLRQRLGDVL